MSEPFRNYKLLSPLLVASMGLVAGCGSSEAPDVASGKELFAQRCGGCHALADAGTKGTAGPDLDDAFKQSLADGMGRKTIKSVVKDQIALPQGKEMPAKIVTGDDADAVAAYVAEVAGR